MIIYLFSAESLFSFVLPKDVFGCYFFDETNDESSKLMNIEAINNKWVLRSTRYVNIYDNGKRVDNVELKPNMYLVLERNAKYYPVFVSCGFDNTFSLFELEDLSNNFSLSIGNGDNFNIKFLCPFIKSDAVKLFYYNEELYLSRNNSIRVYVNDIILKDETFKLKNGDYINVYGLRIYILNKRFLINKIFNYTFFVNVSNLMECFLSRQDSPVNIEIKDQNLYSDEEYFSKAPRFKRIIKTKEINFTSPPGTTINKTLPGILTVGPMLTMSLMSVSRIGSVINSIVIGVVDFSSVFLNIFMSVSMLASTLLWPLIMKKYQARVEKKEKNDIKNKYFEYLDRKKTEIENEKLLQKDILFENLIPLQECLNNIIVSRLSFWSKRIDQNDFLQVRIGMGSVPLDIDISYNSDDFEADYDEVKERVDKLISDYKYIENVPVPYSFLENRLTAIMGPSLKRYSFIDNVILQLVSFYSYEDIKFVLFTNEKNIKRWDYLKYFNHSFSNQKDIRFISSNYESAKYLCDYLNSDYQNRAGIKNFDYKDYPPYYLIITDDYSQIKRLDFIKRIIEDEDNFGFSIIILDELLSKLPSKCSNFILLDNNESRLLKNSFEEQEQTVFTDEIIYDINMFDVSKKISNIPILFQNVSVLEGTLPKSITFLEMEGVGKIEQLNIFNRWKSNDSTQSLKAEVGVDSEGNLMYLDLHEKYHGPHGLIAGMTGSGKSEFIITYILSMAMNYSPNDVSFILIDYKGGGLAYAFENKSSGIILPHLAGTITNLDEAEMHRSLASINSEVKRRQRIFNAARDKLGESTIDIYKYQSFYHDGKLTESLPHLFIICDEFAELKSQQPDFMDNLISVARIGRSLGVHLILATQKPSGVVNDQIWSNTKFRVCLKVQDASDSKEMLKRPDAASLKEAGRFFLQVGYDEYFALGQSGWAGAKYIPSDKVIKEVDKSVNFIDCTGKFIKSIQASKKNNNINNNTSSSSQVEQLSAIMSYIIDLSKKENIYSKRLWLEDIPEIILKSDLEKKYNYIKKKSEFEVVIGEYDAPEKQKQGIVIYNALEQGNTIIYGNDSIEKEMLLDAMIYGFSSAYSPDEVNMVMMDFGSESFRTYSSIPHFGGYVTIAEENRVNILFDKIIEEIDIRKKLLVPYGGEFKQYNLKNENKLPLIIVFLNNYEVFKTTFDELSYSVISDVTRDSERFGMVFIITASNGNSLRSALLQNFKNYYAFKLKDKFDYYGVFGLKTSIFPKSTKGRGFLKNDSSVLHEFQVETIFQENEELLKKNYVDSIIKKYQNSIAKFSIPSLPNHISIDYFSKTIDLKNVFLGISNSDIEEQYANLILSSLFILSSNSSELLLDFTKTFISMLTVIKNEFIFIFDSVENLNLNLSQKNIYYYKSNIENNLRNIIEYIKKLSAEKSKVSGLIIINDLDVFSRCVDDQLLLELSDALKLYNRIGLVIIDIAKKIKPFLMEKWLKNIGNNDNGVWLGPGVSKQGAISCNTTTKLSKISVKDDFGFVIIDGNPNFSKLISY